jgi:hypothetical protein
MLNCGCIMCDICQEKPFNRFSKQDVVCKCPMCEAQVFKEQSRIKIGGMMLRNKVITARHAAQHFPHPLPRASVLRPSRNGMIRTCASSS